MFPFPFCLIFSPWKEGNPSFLTKLTREIEHVPIVRKRIKVEIMQEDLAMHGEPTFTLRKQDVNANSLRDCVNKKERQEEVEEQRGNLREETQRN